MELLSDSNTQITNNIKQHIFSPISNLLMIFCLDFLTI
uniref:Uncharacterized protein n=1 Tax=Anguilla anguilla TaxID=7936 RepID=A0A0E9T6X9_ANGAN